MKISKRVRNGYALALAFALALPCLVKVQTQAAQAIDVDEDCSLTVSVADSEYRDEFSDLSIPVSLYKVADVDASGRYTMADAFAELKGSFDKIGSGTTAEEWSELTKEAVGCLEGLDPEYPVYTAKVEKTAGGADAAEGVFTGLKPGMYLVAPEAVYDKDYAVQYQFTPYLTALPSSNYALSGAGSDEWNYHTTIGLKADSQELPGKLLRIRFKSDRGMIIPFIASCAAQGIITARKSRKIRCKLILYRIVLIIHSLRCHQIHSRLKPGEHTFCRIGASRCLLHLRCIHRILRIQPLKASYRFFRKFRPFLRRCPASDLVKTSFQLCKCICHRISP